MCNIVYRLLEGQEVELARRLSNQNPDVFTAYLLERMPCYFEILGLLDSAAEFRARQRLMLGAFYQAHMVGALFVDSIGTREKLELRESDWELVQAVYSPHEINVFLTLSSDWGRVLIGKPNGSLSIHSLCVDHRHRRQGIGKRLLVEAINRLTGEEQAALHIEVARIRSHMRTCESLGFRVVRKSLSLSARLQFGCWGTALYRLRQDGREVG